MKQGWMGLCAVLALGAVPVQSAQIVDGVMAVVNGDVITFSEVREYVQPVLRQLERDYRGEELLAKLRAAQEDALNNLIERLLIIQEFKEKGYNIPDTVIDQQLNEIIVTDFGGDRAAFTRTLQAQNLTLSQYREKLRERVIVQAMRNRKAQQYMQVSPARIENYYAANQDDFKVEDQVKLRLIFIKKSAPLDGVVPDPDPRRKVGEEILGKLNSGDTFDELAKLYSEGRQAKQGGDWGWIGRDVLRKELNDVAFGLQPGQNSPLIETPEGFYILRVEDFKPAHVKPLTEARDEIEKILMQEQRAKMQAQWIQELRSRAFIRLY